MNATIDITEQQRAMLLGILRQFLPGVEVWAYGSRVKRTARPYSDLDLVVFTDADQSRRVPELREALGESNIPFIVDLHIWDELPESFHQSIREEHVVLQASNGHAVGPAPELAKKLDSPQPRSAAEGDPK